jgi:hypothetical protein
LTAEQKQERVVYCQDLLLMGQDEHFWENIITGDLPTTFSSPMFKFFLKGQHFQTVEDI